MLHWPTLIRSCFKKSCISKEWVVQLHIYLYCIFWNSTIPLRINKACNINLLLIISSIYFALWHWLGLRQKKKTKNENCSVWLSLLTFLSVLELWPWPAPCVDRRVRVTMTTVTTCCSPTRSESSPTYSYRGSQSVIALKCSYRGKLSTHTYCV